MPGHPAMSETSNSAIFGQSQQITIKIPDHDESSQVFITLVQHKTLIRKILAITDSKSRMTTKPGDTYQVEHITYVLHWVEKRQQVKGPFWAWHSNT